jgi:hypothetical protein
MVILPFSANAGFTFRCDYILLGSMYDVVPHTRPLIVNGAAIGIEAEQDLRKSGALPMENNRKRFRESMM